MLDFYKELWLEMQGINPIKKLEKKKQDEDEKINFSYKLILFGISLTYFSMVGFRLVIALKTQDILIIIESVLKLLILLSALILMNFKNKKIKNVSIFLFIVAIALCFVNFGR